MKEKIHYLVEAALAVAVIILFVLYFLGKNNTSKTQEAVSDNEVASEFMSIAYVDLESLMNTYTYSIDLNEQITKKFENSRAKLAEQERRWQSDAADFQRKIETNSFLSRERAEADQQRLLKKQEELQQLAAQYDQELVEYRYRITETLREVIITQLQEYNKNKGYHVIYGKMQDNILYANEAYNITAEVIDFLNRHYAATPSLKPTD